MTRVPAALPANAVRALLDMKRGGVRPGLERMQRLAAALGHPERRVPVLHVAGTNGKGSTCAMLEAIWRQAGWRTGLYTSPHLVRLAERIQINRVPIAVERLALEIERLRREIETWSARFGAEAVPTYFEFMTGLALRYFAEEKCDVIILETGLGGRMDATNIVTPELSVITSIGLDHMEFLGPTLGSIAAEKAGIIKPGRPVVLGRLPREAEDVVRAAALRRGSVVRSVDQEFGRDVAALPSTNLAGVYQRINAATATLVARSLAVEWRLDQPIVASALMQVDWSGRWQEMALDGRTLVVDSTHNAEGAAVLDANLHRLQQERGRRPAVIVGVLGRARAESILEAIARHAREIHLVVPAQSRACSHDELAALLPRDFAGAVRRSSLDELFPRSHVCALDGDVVVTGSVYLAGEVLSRIDPAYGSLESQLQDF